MKSKEHDSSPYPVVSIPVPLRKKSIAHSINQFVRHPLEQTQKHHVKIWHIFSIALLFLVLLCSMIYLVRIESHKCTISDSELDHCGETLGFFPSGIHSHLPETQQELDHYCKERRHSVQCLKRYVHSCLEVDKDQKRLVKKYVSGYKRQLDDLCLHRLERQKFINASHCLNEQSLMHSFEQCTIQHQNRLLYIAQFVPDSYRIGTACCSIHLKYHCYSNLVSSRCPKSSQRFVMQQIEGPFRSIVQNVCSPYFLSMKGCQRRIDGRMWNAMVNYTIEVEHHNVTVNTNLTKPLLPDREEEEVAEAEELRSKIERLKFRESILALIFIARPSTDDI